MDNAAPPTAPGASSHGEQPDPHAGPRPDAGPRVSTAEMRDFGRLRRSTSDRYLAGVAGGLARHLDIDPILVRVGFVVAAFFGGAGILLYVAGWLLVPEDGTDERPLGLDDRNRGIAITAVAVLALLAAVGDWAGAYWFPWPVAIVALAILWFTNRQRDRGATARPGHPQASYAVSPPAEGDAEAAPQTGPGWSGQQWSGQEWSGQEWAGQQSWSAIDYSRAPRRNPRRRGPVLFWFTLALIALAEGVLGVVDLAGASVSASAYPALALAITAVMLVVGAFWGRAGGLILIGLVAALFTAGSAIGGDWDARRDTHVPTTASEVDSLYEMHSGELVIDLTQVGDLAALDGREIGVEAGVGRVEVLVPRELGVTTSVDVGLGGVDVFGEESGGVGVTYGADHSRTISQAAIDLTVDMGVGEVVIREK